MANEFIARNGLISQNNSTITGSLTVTENAVVKNTFIGSISAFGDNYSSLSHTSRAGTGDYSILSENNGTTYLNASTGQSLKFRINNIDKAVLDANGNLGIGTDMPTQLLDVTSISSNAVINLDGASPGTTGLIFKGYGTERGRIVFENSDDMTFVVGSNFSNERMRITSAGNVGIGTTAPETKLHIEDVTKTLTGNVAGVAQGTLSLVTTDAQDADVGPSLIFGGNFTDNSSTRIAYAGIAGRKTNSTSVNADGYLSFLTWRSTGLTEAMRITPAGFLALGTTDAGVRFVNAGGAAASGPTLGSGAIGSQALVSENSLYGMWSGVSNNGDVWHQVQRNDGNTATYNLLFNPAGGNVGIGTTSPGASLDILATSLNVLRLGRTGYDTYTFRSSIGTGLELFNTTDLRSEMFFDGAGNVGIGTTTPTYTLDVSGSGGSTVRFKGTAGQATISLNDGTTDNYIVALSGRLQLRPSGNTALTALSTGLVGIGTTTPTYRLQIDSAGSTNSNLPLTLTSVDVNNRVGILFGSSSLASGRQHRLFHRTTTSLAEWIMDTTAGASANWTLTPTDNSAYAVTITTPFATGSDARMYAGSNHRSLTLSAGGSNDALVIRSGSGNVGIGTASPAKLLDVNGDVLINGQTVGRGGGNISSNTTVGPASLFSNTTGTNNVSIGTSTLFLNTTGANNVAIGTSGLGSNISGNANTAIGQGSLQSSTGGANSAIGQASLSSITSGGNNIAFGRFAGRYIADKVTLLTSIDNSVLIGYQASPLGQAQTNQIVIGYDATGLGSNTTVLGNSSTTTTAIYGNVGIGTTTPTNRLTIHKWSTGGNFSNANQLKIQSDNWGGGAGYGLEIGYYHDWPTVYGSRIQSKTNNIGDSLLLNPDGGNVGIGTTAPSTTLHVNGGIIQIQTATGNTFYGQDSGGSYARTFGVELYDFRNAAGATRVRINTSTGNVGIGTTNPGYKLDVSGSLNVAGAVTIASPLNVGSVPSALTTAGGVLLLANGKVAINSTGNVGIGTSTPNAKLDVSGSAIISGSLTSTGGFIKPGAGSEYLLADGTTTAGGGGGGSSTIIDDSVPTVVDGGTWYQPASGSFSVGITGSWVTVGRDGANGADGAPGTVTTGSVSYITIASDLVSRITTSSGAWDFSQAGIIDATISSNTSASFSNLQLNKTLKVKIMVSGSAALSFPSYCKPTVGSVNPSGTNGTYYAYFDCWNATSGSEIVLQSIVQLA